MLLSQNPPVETQNSQPDAMVTDSPLNSGHFMSNTAGELPTYKTCICYTKRCENWEFSEIP